MIRRVWAHRDLVLSLARRNYQLRYRQSLAGFFWALAPPLISVGVATLVFHRVARIDTGGTPYALFALAALAPWTFFANCLTYAATSVVQAHGIITRIPFPRAALPIAMSVTVLIDLAVASLAFLAFASLTGAGLPKTALWFPVLLLVEIVLTLGLVLLISALNVFVRDVHLAVPFLVQALLLVTPVMYPLKAVPEALRSWYMLNPMTGLMESFRDVLLYGQPPTPSLLMPAVLGAIAALLLGSWYFWATENRFADVA
jgi:ABC-type polysaccharide/polyol phosphate export permease